jgi:protein arginine N-methyltransferase 1
MYSVHDYGAMIGDRVRMDAYTQALRHVVRPGSVVLDLGAGAGVFSMIACRLGARRVYAIEPSNIIEVGRQIAAANHCADRIMFFQERSEDVCLPERVDVIVSDMRGVLPCLDRNLRTFIDARERFLAHGGAVIAKRDRLWAAVVEAPELYLKHFIGWDDALGFDQRAAAHILANSWSRGRVAPGQLLTEPCCWSTLDYETIDSSDVSSEFAWMTTRSGTAHGLIVWFDAEVSDAAGFSNAPGQPELIYGSAFFPWLEPVPVDGGDRVKVRIDARITGGDSYVWSWDSCIGGLRDVRAEFRQTTLLGEAISSEVLKRRAVQYKPALGEDGAIDRFVLIAMTGRTSVGTIARRLLIEFPNQFANLKAAMKRVGELSERYAR